MIVSKERELARKKILHWYARITRTLHLTTTMEEAYSKHFEVSQRLSLAVTASLRLAIGTYEYVLRTIGRRLALDQLANLSSSLVYITQMVDRRMEGRTYRYVQIEENNFGSGKMRRKIFGEKFHTIYDSLLAMHGIVLAILVVWL